jgi:hypothetical protein
LKNEYRRFRIRGSTFRSDGVSSPAPSGGGAAGSDAAEGALPITPDFPLPNSTPSTPRSPRPPPATTTTRASARSSRAAIARPAPATSSTPMSSSSTAASASSTPHSRPSPSSI